MTKRQLNSTYCRLRREVKRVQQRYETLAQTMFDKGYGVRWYPMGVVWKNYYRGVPARYTHIQVLRQKKHLFQMFIQELEALCQ